MLVGLVLAKGWQRGLAWRRGVGTKFTVGRAVRLSVWVKACEDLITMGSGRVTGTLLSLVLADPPRAGSAAHLL